MKPTPITTEELEQARERTAALLETCDTEGNDRPRDASQMQTLVTELKTHQAELEAQNENLREMQVELTRMHNRYASLYEFAPIGYLTVDEQGVITSANVRAALLFDLERASLVGTALTKFIRSADRAAFESTLAGVLSRHGKLDTSPECEVRMITLRGETIHARLEISASHDSEVREARIALVDMTALREAERQLESYNLELERLVDERTREKTALEYRLTQIAELSPDAIVLLDSHGRIRYASPALARMLGMPLQELEGAELAIWVDTRDQAMFRTHVRESRCTANASPLTLRLVRPSDGTLLWLDVTSQPMPEEATQGSPGLVVVLRDVTERFLAERERDRLQDVLFEVSERHQQDLGVELHEQVAQSVAGSAMIAHRLVSELSRASNPEADKAKQLVGVLNDVTDQVRRVATLLSPLIDPGGLSTSLHRLAVDLERRYGIRTHVDVDESIEIDDASSTQLFWTADEAVSNVAKHAHATQMWIRWERAEEGVRLEIADDGVGLPQPLPAARGIGFEVIRARAHRIGCTLNLESEPANGTRVTVHCPAAKA